MDTLRSIMFGCDADSGESWGYVSESGVEIRLGNKHYAERICIERGAACVKLDTVKSAIPPIEHKPELGEGTTFKSFLSCDLIVFLEAVRKYKTTD